MREEPSKTDAVFQASSREEVAGSGSAKSSGGLDAVAPPVVPIKQSDRARQQEFLWKVHGYTNDYIRFADTKAAFCVGIASALMGALFATKAHELFTKVTASHWSSLAKVSFGSFVVLAASIAAAVTVIGPRLWTHSEKGFIFWGDVSKFESSNAFAVAYKAQTDEDLDKSLSRHLYMLATICKRKYFWASVSILAVVVGGMLS